MIKKLISLSTLLTLPLNAIAANQPYVSLLQPKIFEPVIQFLVSIAIMFTAILFVVALIAKRFNPKYKDSSIIRLMIYLWLDSKQINKKEGTVVTVGDEYPYERKNLLEKSEKDFFKALEIAVLNKYHIFPQVGLSRIISVERSIKNNKQGHLNRILQKSVDFVICDKTNFSTLLVIELDGESHNTKDQQESDDFKNKALSKAGIDLMRHIVQPTYNADQIKEKLRRYIKLEPDKPTLQSRPQKENICTSPGCNGTMTIRPDKTGKKYWVCSEYNKCKTAVAVEEARLIMNV